MHLWCCRNNQKQWRLHDLEQRSLDNARVLWGRFMEKNRRDVEERAEQLKSLGNLAALVAGFAVVAFLEFGETQDFTENPTLTLSFGITAALVVRSSASALAFNSLGSPQPLSLCGPCSHTATGLLLELSLIHI